ncbi:hypothetical protein ACFL24_00280 [Patescibacteria group bacterium]
MPLRKALEAGDSFNPYNIFLRAVADIAILPDIHREAKEKFLIYDIFKQDPREGIQITQDELEYILEIPAKAIKAEAAQFLAYRELKNEENRLQSLCLRYWRAALISAAMGHFSEECAGNCGMNIYHSPWKVSYWLCANCLDGEEASPNIIYEKDCQRCKKVTPWTIGAISSTCIICEHPNIINADTESVFLTTIRFMCTPKIILPSIEGKTTAQMLETLPNIKQPL